MLLLFGVVHTGAAATVSLDDLVKITGEPSAFGNFGAYFSVGDINNDGFEDVFVNAFGLDYSYLIMGSATELTDNFISTTYTARYTGVGLPTIADVNGDGDLDLLFVGETADEATVLYLIYGDGTVPSGTITVSDDYDARFVEESELATLQTVQSGDFNGDDIDDILVSADYKTSEFVPADGAIYVIYGSATNFSGSQNIAAVYDARFLGEEQAEGSTAARFSDFMATGDINGDSFDDIIVAAHGYHPIGSDPDTDAFGAVYLLYGGIGVNLIEGDGNISDVYDAKFTHDPGTWTTGRYLAVGDLNGDTADDIAILVATDETLGRGDTAGSTYIIYGGENSNVLIGDIALSAYDAKFIPPGDVDTSVGLPIVISDINADGAEDIFLGFAGDPTALDNFAYILYGGTGTDEFVSVNSVDISDVSYEEEIASTLEENGISALALADLNGDGVKDAIISIMGDSTTALDAGALFIDYAIPAAVVSATNGDITVPANSISAVVSTRFDVFDLETVKKTVVSQLDEYYLVLHPRAKRLALVNSAGEIIAQKVIRTTVQAVSRLQVLNLRNDDQLEILVTTKKRKASSRLQMSVLSVNVSAGTFGKIVSRSVRDPQADINYITYTDNQLRLRTAAGTVIARYRYTKSGSLQLVED